VYIGQGTDGKQEQEQEQELGREPIHGMERRKYIQE